MLVRPSYVLGGRAMEIVYDDEELDRYMSDAVQASPDRPILVDKFLEDAIEVQNKEAAREGLGREREGDGGAGGALQERTAIGRAHRGELVSSRRPAGRRSRPG